MEDWVLPILFPYGTLALAYLPAGFVRKFNRLGDYSYGLYVYAFPVQQSLMAFYLAAQPKLVGIRVKAPAWNVWPYFFASFFIALFLAVLSWQMVEKPALQFFQRISRSPKKREPIERRW